MGVSSLNNRATFSGNGVSVSFNFPYYFFLTTDLAVFLYDTAAGTIDPQVLGTDYTISGTPNAQGLYINGANVVFGTAPPTGTGVAVVRIPPEVQNYSLLQNGTISSAAIVQQLDYLTLEIQRLQDLANRSIRLPDGITPAFAMVLPDGTVLSPGGYVRVNQLGTGITLDTSTPPFTKITVPYTDLQTGATTIHFGLFNLPAGAMLTNLAIKHTTAFTGVGITALNASLGIVTDYPRFIPAFDLKASVGDQVFDNVMMNYIASFANVTAIYLSADSTGANLSALSAGSVDIYYSYTFI